MTDMHYRALGQSGLNVSAVGLGGNNFGRVGTATYTHDGATAVIHAALDAGVNFIDTADIYGAEYGLSERLVGEAVRGRRDEVVIATKFGHARYDTPIPSWGARGSRRYLRQAVEGSLTRLGTDWIDLYQLHTPDPNTPIAETLSTLNDLVREGKIRYIGHSNFSGWQLAEADLLARQSGGVAFVSAQNEYSLLARSAEQEVLPAVRHFGLGFLPYFPLYNGLLTGKFSRSGGPEDTRIMRQRRHIVENAPWDRLDAYRDFCRNRGITMLQGTFGWLLAQPNLTSVIAGVTRPGQIQQNVTAATSWVAGESDVAAISDIFSP